MKKCIVLKDEKTFSSFASGINKNIFPQIFEDVKKCTMFASTLSCVAHDQIERNLVNISAPRRNDRACKTRREEEAASQKEQEAAEKLQLREQTKKVKPLFTVKREKPLGRDSDRSNSGPVVIDSSQNAEDFPVGGCVVSIAGTPVVGVGILEVRRELVRELTKAKSLAKLPEVELCSVNDWQLRFRKLYEFNKILMYVWYLINLFPFPYFVHFKV